MDYEKAYKEALERARKLYKDAITLQLEQDIKDYEQIFPELKENSEDEKFRKYILKCCEETIHADDRGLELSMDTTKKLKNWLEKQGEKTTVDKIHLGKKYKCIASPRYSTFMTGKIYKPEDKFLCSLMNFCSDCFEPLEDGEQNPAEWNEEDENWFNEVWRCVSKEYPLANSYIFQWLKNRLKSLKERVQPKQEWSEEDKEYIEACIEVIDNFYTLSGELKKLTKIDAFRREYAEKLKSWLKSLRPQNWTKEDKERYISCLQRLSNGNPEQPETINSKWFKEHVYPQNRWKPSDEQIKGIECAIKTLHHQLNIGDNRLDSLYDDLKKLREE